MEITATCKICKKKFTYERKRNKSKTPYTRKCCDTCRTSENKKRATYATKKKQCEELNGIIAGLKDFAEGRCKHFKNDEELEEYLMELPESMRTNLKASIKRNKEAFDCLKSL